MKRATNITADAELIDEAKSYGINLSRTFQEALEAKVKAERARRWLEENREALDEYARYLEDNELVADRLRAF